MSAAKPTQNHVQSPNQLFRAAQSDSVNDNDLEHGRTEIEEAEPKNTSMRTLVEFENWKRVVTVCAYIAGSLFVLTLLGDVLCAFVRGDSIPFSITNLIMRFVTLFIGQLVLAGALWLYTTGKMFICVFTTTLIGLWFTHMGVLKF